MDQEQIISQDSEISDQPQEEIQKEKSYLRDIHSVIMTKLSLHICQRNHFSIVI